MTRCVLCNRGLEVGLDRLDHESAYQIRCRTCGTFIVETRDIDSNVFQEADLQPFKHLLSAATKASVHAPLKVDRKMRDDVRSGVIVDKPIDVKMELMVRYFAARSSQLGERIPSRPLDDYPIAWCRSEQEWSAALRYHHVAGLLSPHQTDSTTFSVEVTLHGWQWLHQQPKASGSKAFIAMAFDPELNEVRAAIQLAIEQAGYDPLRVDDDHYSGGVMDRIIMHIRDSKFIVADFTKNRGGVYYEAGVAFGLGIDVVNVCQDGCLVQGAKDQLHFDVRHLVFVPWKADQLAKFSEELRNHIIAVHGRGPRPV